MNSGDTQAMVVALVAVGIALVVAVIASRKK